MQKAMFLNFFIFSHLFYENIIIVKKEYSKKKKIFTKFNCHFLWIYWITRKIIIINNLILIKSHWILLLKNFLNKKKKHFHEHKNKIQDTIKPKRKLAINFLFSENLFQNVIILNRILIKIHKNARVCANGIF